MIDRKPEMSTLWWTSGDKQASMFGGNYASEQEAEDAIPAVEAEFRSECTTDSPWDEESSWSVERPDDDDDE